MRYSNLFEWSLLVRCYVVKVVYDVMRWWHTIREGRLNTQQQLMIQNYISGQTVLIKIIVLSH